MKCRALTGAFVARLWLSDIHRSFCRLQYGGEKPIYTEIEHQSE